MARTAAAVALLDRGHGKPKQAIDMGVTEYKAVSFSPISEDEWEAKYGNATPIPVCERDPLTENVEDIEAKPH